MNCLTRETVESCAKDAGAIEPCQMDCGNHAHAWHEEVDRRTCALATSSWKVPESGLCAMTIEQVRSAVWQFLQDCPRICFDFQLHHVRQRMVNQAPAAPPAPAGGGG